jgi:hypothetical protein
MTRYTVTALPSVEDDLARIWLSAPDRKAVSRASDEIDQILAEDAPLKGEEAGEKLRRLVVPPLVAEFTVEEDDRKVTIWSISHIGRLFNGR